MDTTTLPEAANDTPAGPTKAVVDYKAILASKVAILKSKIGAPSGDKIRITQAKNFVFPDGKESKEPFEAIILDFVSNNRYYVSPYNKNEMTAPDCWALGEEPATMAPPENVKDRQSDDCASCPQNQFKSAANGRGKACANTRLLAIIPPDADPDTPVWLLGVSPTAIRGFDAYVAKIMAEFGQPPIGVVTTIAFDPKFDYPTLRFGNPRPNEAIELSVGMMEAARQRLLTEPDYDAMDAKVAVAPAARAGRSSARISR